MVHVNLGAGLLLASTMLVGVAATPAHAATGCEDPAATTWVATEGGSTSWAEPNNWDHGLPTATSVVCIPGGIPGPDVETTDAAADVIDASDATVALAGKLTVGTSFDVAALQADGGTLVGGTTTVADSLTGSGLTLQGGAVLDQWGSAELDDWMAQGARITVHGAAELAPGAEIDTLGGLFTIAQSGSLTLDAPSSSADVVGGFANHGEVTVVAGRLLMMGASPEDALPQQFSTGTFSGAPDTLFNVAYTELRTGARLDHVMADHIAVVGTTKLGDGALIDDVRVAQSGRLDADLGSNGTASLTGADVDGTVRVSEGILDVAFSPGSAADDVLTGGRYIAADGATLKLPATHTLDADLRLVGPGSSFGTGIDGLGSIAPSGNLELLGGADLATSGGLENLGRVRLSSDSDLEVGGRFSQGPRAQLTTQVGAVGRGQVVAAGRLVLDGDLVLQRDPGYRPVLGTKLWVLRGSTRRGTEFARVLGRDTFAGRRFMADYSLPDRMRLRVR